MKKKESESSVRLKRVLLHDNLQIQTGVLQALKNDLTHVLNSYFDVVNESVTVEVTVDEKGEYDVCLGAKGASVKKVKVL